jgi:hypothetical protein
MSISKLKLPELKTLAGELKIKGRTKMKKEELVEAIKKAKKSEKKGKKGNKKKEERILSPDEKDLYHIDTYRLTPEEIDYAVLEVIKYHPIAWRIDASMAVHTTLRILGIPYHTDQFKFKNLLTTSLLRVKNRVNPDNFEKDVNEIVKEQKRLRDKMKKDEKLKPIIKKIEKNCEILREEAKELDNLWQHHLTTETTLLYIKKIEKKYSDLLHKIKREKEDVDKDFKPYSEDIRVWNEFSKSYDENHKKRKKGKKKVSGKSKKSKRSKKSKKSKRKSKKSRKKSRKSKRKSRKSNRKSKKSRKKSRKSRKSKKK